MKCLKRVFFVFMAIVVCLVNCSTAVFAKSKTEDYQKSVVYIGTTVKFQSSNFGFSFKQSFSGTGFAVGKPGKPVQYIATCAHCVQMPKGVYAVFADANGNLIDCVSQQEGTVYPKKGQMKHNGIDCTVYIDYFQPETVDLYAMFSNSSNDYTTLTLAQINRDVDLALCKLSSEPTDRLSALPLQLKDDVEIRTDVLAIGFAGASAVFDAEGRLEGKDSTIEDGIISKKTRTHGNKGSETTYDVFEVTAALKHGMSGGPVISEKSGSIVGVTSFGYVDKTEGEAARYAICIDYLIPMLESEGIDYVLDRNGLPVWAIILIVLGGLLVVAAAVVAFLIIKKKKAEEKKKSVKSDAAATAPVEGCYLLGVSGIFEGKKFKVDKHATIGRDGTKCNIVFPIEQPGVSGVHCEVEVGDGVITLKDCGSSFGTFLLDGTKLAPNSPMIVTNGSRFYVASKENVFEVRV